MKNVFFALAILILVVGFVVADSFVATIIIEDVPALTVSEGDSLSYYLKQANKYIIDYSSVSYGPTLEDLKKLQDLPKTSSVASTSLLTYDNVNEEERSIVWNNILTSGNHSVKFNKVKLGDGKEYSLAVILRDDWRAWAGHRAIEVQVNGVTVECQNKWSIFRNLTGTYVVVSTGLNQSEICQAQIGKQSYALRIENFNMKEDGRYEMILKSPLIPSNCPKTISGNMGILNPVC